MNIKIIVRGSVQGVFFRASTRDKAVELGLKGFVQNQPDGSVYVEVQGSRVPELLSWIKAGGPPMASVGEVIVEEIDSKKFTGFEVRH